jgi:hypothetical protein
VKERKTMPADPKMWDAFIEHLEKMIEERRADLVPLESGTMKLGHRGADTNWEWVDITEPQAQSLRNEIVSIQSTIDRVKKDHA